MALIDAAASVRIDVYGFSPFGVVGFTSHFIIIRPLAIYHTYSVSLEI